MKSKTIFTHPLRFAIALMFTIGLNPQGQAQIETSKEKTLRIALGQDFDTLNPFITGMLASSYIYNMVARKLVTLDENMKVIPQLAEAIPDFKNHLAKEITINGKKKIQALWKLRSSANWGDGSPVTCADIEFSKTVGSNSNIAVANRDAFDQVESVECDSTDPKLVKLTYSNNRWDYYKMFQFFILPAKVEKTIYDQFKDQKEGYEKNTAYVKDPTNKALFNGPYIISDLKVGSHVVLAQNSQFYGTRPKIDKIIFKIITNSSTLEANLLSSEVDMLANVGLNIDTVLTLDKKISEQKLPFQSHYVSGFSYEHIDLNLDNAILKNPQIRKALNLAVDRELLVSSLFDGKQSSAIHFLTKNDPWSKNLKIKFPDQNLSRKEAEKILDTESWRPGKDGYRYKNGEKLSFVISSTAGNKLRETVEVFLQDQFKKIGVDLQIKNYPARVFFGEIIKSRKFDAMAMFSWTFLPETSPSLFYNSSNIPNEKNGHSGRNYAGWKNSIVDKNTLRLEIEPDPKRRQEYILRIVQEYVKDRPTIPLYYRADVSVTPKNLKGYKPTGHQQMESNFVENWEL